MEKDNIKTAQEFIQSKELVHNGQTIHLSLGYLYKLLEEYKSQPISNVEDKIQKAIKYVDQQIDYCINGTPEAIKPFYPLDAFHMVKDYLLSLQSEHPKVDELKEAIDSRINADWKTALRSMRDNDKFDDKFDTKTLEFVYAFQMGYKTASVKHPLKVNVDEGMQKIRCAGCGDTNSHNVKYCTKKDCFVYAKESVSVNVDEAAEKYFNDNFKDFLISLISEDEKSDITESFKEGAKWYASQLNRTK